MSLLDLMNACPNIAVVHVGDKTQVIKDSNRKESNSSTKSDNVK